MAALYQKRGGSVDDPLRGCIVYTSPHTYRLSARETHHRYQHNDADDRGGYGVFVQQAAVRFQYLFHPDLAVNVLCIIPSGGLAIGAVRVLAPLTSMERSLCSRWMSSKRSRLVLVVPGIGRYSITTTMYTHTSISVGTCGHPAHVVHIGRPMPV